MSKKRWVLFYLFFAIIGGVLGFTMGDTLSGVFRFTWSFVDIIVTVVLFVIVYFLLVTVHEFGHYVMGKMLNYELLMYRVSFLAFKKENGKMRFHIERNKGYSGLCAMLPDQEANPVAKRHIWYYGGGILFNLLSGLIAVPFALSSDGYLQLFFVLFIALSVIVALVNLFPFKTKQQLITDGAYMFGLLRPNRETKAIFATTKFAVALRGGVRPRELSLQVEGEIENPTLMIYSYYQALDQLDVEAMKEGIDKILTNINQYPEVFKIAIYYEVVTFGILTNDLRTINLYIDEVKKKVSKDQDLNGRRVQAYVAYWQDDIPAARKYIEAARQVEHFFPLPGQAKMEVHLLDYLQTLIDERAIKHAE